MRSPTSNGEIWIELDEVESTQTEAINHVRDGSNVGILFAHEQTGGHGRFDRKWISQKEDSLTASLIFRAYADHPKPYLVGMATALAVAGVLHCRLRWPNDLTFNDLKIGGILTQLLPDAEGKLVPVVGVGINLNQKEFPDEIAAMATSLSLSRGGNYDPQIILHKIVQRFESLPEPNSWADLRPIWDVFDFTPGKQYRLPSGELSLALGIGSEGQLLCSVDGESRSVLAAEAIFG